LFFKNIFNEEFIKKSYLYVYENYAISKNSKSEEFVKFEPIFEEIKNLHKIYFENEGDYFPGAMGQKSSSNRIMIENNQKQVQISLNPPPLLTYEEKNNPYIYSIEMDKILFSRFSYFGMHKDFESLMRYAYVLYSNDEITKFIELLRLNKKLQEIIISKKDEFFVTRFNLEAQMITNVDNEMQKNVEVN
jgi:hypothetical protein